MYPRLSPWYHANIDSGPRYGKIYLRKVETETCSIYFVAVSDKGIWTDNYYPSEAMRDIRTDRTPEGKLIPLEDQTLGDDAYAKAFVNSDQKFQPNRNLFDFSRAA